jgi:tripartite-type tricarboxylate transporter receptor subunit TctC
VTKRLSDEVTRTSSAISLTCLAAAFALALPVAAQEYPARPVRIVIGFPPGGATDLVSRLLAPKFAEVFKQQVVVDNRPGANGVIAADLVAKSLPDGYTLHLGTLASQVISPAISKVPYDPFKDFSPIGRTVALQNIFIVHPSLPVRSIKELIALARSEPGKLNFASSGTGSTGHLSGELFKTMAGVDLVHIPYKGGGPALTDLIAGHVEIFIAIVSTAVPHVRSGRARALAVTGNRRAEALPDVPTVAESALKGYESTNWYCMVGPANLPQGIVSRWNKEMVAALSLADVRKTLLDMGIEPAPSTPAELAAYLKSETAKWGKVIKASGLKAD